MPKRTFKLYADEGKGGPEYRLEAPEVKGKPPLEFRGPDWDLHFVIQPNNYDLRFKPVPTDAFWASTSGCPQQSSQVGGLKPMKVFDKGQKLRVTNRNAAAQLIHFSLQFEGDHVPPYDPIIDNKNGPAELSPSLRLASCAALATSAALIGLVLLNRNGKRQR